MDRYLTEAGKSIGYFDKVRFIGAVLLVAVITGYLDYITGPTVLFEVFYIVPLSLSAWYSGKNLAFAISIFSAITRVSVYHDGFPGNASNMLFAYNLVEETSLFMAISYFISSIKQHLNSLNKSAEELRYLSYHDKLTELPNRVLLSDRIQQAIAAAKRDKVQMVLMFIDLDKFKPINDALGHAIGDLLLKETATRIQNCLRESDTAARIGGDEFVVLLPVITEKQDAMLIAEKICSTLNQPFELSGNHVHISSSIGIAVYPENGTDEKMLLKNSDTAMYFAKASGRNMAKFF
jgi:diguanylate cyclase (GGDEF)-like protein